MWPARKHWLRLLSAAERNAFESVQSLAAPERNKIHSQENQCSDTENRRPRMLDPVFEYPCRPVGCMSGVRKEHDRAE